MNSTATSITSMPRKSRNRNWKIHFRVKNDWFAGQSMRPTAPRPVNLRTDPLVQHPDAPGYPLYAGEKLWIIMPAAYILKLHAETFKDFPPSQAPPDFNPGAIWNTRSRRPPTEFDIIHLSDCNLGMPGKPNWQRQ
jgi:hypothetical protein